MDGDPDAGEVVWTWVPYEEHDGRGKDRPILVVASETAGSLLGVMLTSKPHHGADYVAVGPGGWDVDRRPSWAVLDRVVRIWPDGMRREGASLDERQFERVAARLRQRYGWR